MSVKELASANGWIRLHDLLPESKFVGRGDFKIQSCCSRWDECEPNDLYVAIVDSESDGHEFAREAIKRGASAVLSERLLAIDLPQCIVEDSRRALGAICHALAGSPSQRISTVGVSGSDGKTVTSHLIHSIFESAGHQSGLLSSIESRTGRKVSGPDSTVVSPTFAEQLSTMVMSGCTRAVVEMPGMALAQHRLAGVSLDAAVVTNLRDDRMALYGSRENFLRANTRILDYLKPTGFAVFNADDPTTYAMLDQIETPALTIGIKQKAEITGRIIERNSGDQTFLICAGGESAVVRTSIIGDQHIYNCMAATAVGLTSGLELSTIARGLEAAATIPGRLERITCGQPYGVWIDAAHTPRQVATAIQSIKRVTSGKVWCIGSIRDDQSPANRKALGRVLEKAADRQIITNASMNKTTDYEPAHQVLDGFNKPSKANLIPNRMDAIEWALSQAKPKDAVVITGCGERPIAQVGGQQWQISDRDVCQAWLYDRADWGKPSSSPNIFPMDDYR